MPLGFFSSIIGAASNAAQNAVNVRNQRDENAANRDLAAMLNQQNIDLQRETNALNLEYLRETNAQNLRLQYESWGREDNAVQRRTSDLRAAGLNPVLAAGGAAQASGPIQLQAPHAESPRAAHRAQMQAARVQFETDLVERSLRMRDDFATNAKTRELLDATADEHRARAEEIRRGTGFENEVRDARIQQLGESLANLGEQTTLLKLQQENTQLRNIHQVSENQMAAIDAAIHQEVRQAGLDEMMERIIALEVENRILQYDQEKREELGIPSTGSVQEKGIHFIRNEVQNFVDAVEAWAEDGNFFQRAFSRGVNIITRPIRGWGN